MSEGNERNYVIGILGENHKLTENIGGAFGSPGQKTDLQFYDRLEPQLNAVFCAIDAIGYPEKLKSLIHAMMISDFHILLVDLETGINAAIGEIIVTMDIFVRLFNTVPFVAIGNINEKNEYMLEKVKKGLTQILATTSLKNIEILELRTKEDREELKKLIIETAKKISLPSIEKSDTVVMIDHVFPVKGIGTVILGMVKSGMVTASEMLNLVGMNKKVIIRSIQKQDRDFKTAIAGDRVGLAIKGIKPEDIDRNMILAASGLFTTSKKFKVKATVSPYFKENLGPESSRQFTLFMNLATAPFKVLGGDNIKPSTSGSIEIELNKEIPIPVSGGKGLITELNKFENKLRVVGSFEIQ